jgi:hypothetical protein
MVAQPAKHEKLEVGATVLCGTLLLNWVLGICGTYGRSTQVRCDHQDGVVPFFTASVSYRATQLLVSIVLWVISQLSHQAE